MQTPYRTIGLWTFLIILFFALFKAFTGPADGGSPSAPKDDPVLVWSFLQWLPIVFLFLFFVFFIRQMKKGVIPSVAGDAAYAAGYYVEALENFSKAAEAAPRAVNFRFAEALTLMQLGRLGAAEASAQKVEPMLSVGDVRITMTRSHFVAGLSNLRALTAALSGRLDEAKAQVARRAAIQPPLRFGTIDGWGRLAAAVVACREQRWAEAHQLLRTTEVLCLGGKVGVLARAIAVWVAVQGGAPPQPVDRVALFGEADPTELRRGWPEFFAFVDQAPQL